MPRLPLRSFLLRRSFSSKPAYVQDGPPPGGYAQVPYKRNIPDKGPSNVAMCMGMGAVLTYGWYFTLQSIHARNRVKVETFDTRMTVLPYLQAEEDQRFVEVRAIMDAKERELMKDVPGWQPKTNHFETVEWVRPKAMPF